MAHLCTLKYIGVHTKVNYFPPLRRTCVVLFRQNKKIYTQYKITFDVWFASEAVIKLGLCCCCCLSDLSLVGYRSLKYLRMLKFDFSFLILFFSILSITFPFSVCLFILCSFNTP